MKSFIFGLYQWLIAFPVLLLATIITALLTTILSPLLPNCQFSYFPARWWGRLFCYLLFIKVRVYGIENIEQKKSYIFAANHQSIYDIFVIYGWLPAIFKWIMKAELRRIPLIGRACAAAGHVFIDRTNAIAAKHSIEFAEKQLSKGASVVIFPEGTRSYDGNIGKFKRGVFRLASDLMLPIVPITLKGCFEVLPRSSYKVNPGTIELFIHEPIHVTNYLPEKMDDLMQITYNTIKSKM